MMRGSAAYEIDLDGRVVEAHVFGGGYGKSALSPIDAEAHRVVMRGFCRPEYAGKAGYSIDPYKAAEANLAEHYGYAKMVEADYEWQPYIRY